MNEPPENARQASAPLASGGTRPTPTPLGYETPRAWTSGRQSPSTVVMALAFIGGFIVGVGGILILSLLAVGFVEASQALDSFRAICFAAGTLCVFSLFVAMSLAIRLMMRPGWRTIDRWESLGLLLGAALSLLLSLMGIYFAMT